MFMTDPVADMLSQIRNAQAVSHPTVDIPWSNLKYEIAKILEKEGFIGNIEKKGRHPKKKISITLKYTNDEERPGLSRVEPAMQGLKRISKPGQRIYLPAGKIKRVRGGYGVAIISTSKGLMVDKEARRQRLGGEILCEAW
ncbi:MAG: 30S ribosomal protein S8 [Candidatus Wildermuthbacteria bacterium RIFCSPLOWO2_01_FULL_48_35]|uniref:Small ribosomal subunit protein uS8 n=1 Tax=Candidatus Wildermuthbacteria bacterium RIFCSPLOWO2_01_FULL_48_35 TaxID=1802463 RepID=A0A1G2RM85_9BACT|nr:MAG: 30S ribosomal protein S8 [Candidatus Wildermuthbacteria bacterium RIFCSPLOWO2_01_FULL_48_35]